VFRQLAAPGPAVIRVCLVENETLVREGLRRVLELDDGVAVAGEARDGVEALELLERVRPDVALLDVRMPRLDGIGVLQALRSEAWAPPCLVLTTFDDADAFLAAVRAGARGYLLKDATSDELGQGIRCVAAGGSWLKPSLTENVLRALREDRPAEIDGKLTGREVEVLRLLAGGYSNREIGSALAVSERTVKNHVSSILGKLWVRDRTRAVLKAIAQRLI
jgi:DNA-binding NarL/FixJ family response regulator